MYIPNIPTIILRGEGGGGGTPEQANHIPVTTNSTTLEVIDWYAEERECSQKQPLLNHAHVHTLHTVHVVQSSVFSCHVALER